MKVLQYTFITIVFAALASTAFAQLSIGARGGIHLANWSVNDALQEDIGDTEIRLSPLIGAVVEMRFNDNMAIQGELIFLQKGFKKEVNLSDSIFGDASGRTDYIFNHIEVPVLFKFGSTAGPVRVDGLIGPGFSYALSGNRKERFTLNGESETDTIEIDFEDDNFSRTDVSLHLGAVVTLKLGERANVFLDGRFLLGFTNLNATDSPQEARSRGVSLSAGALFPL